MRRHRKMFFVFLISTLTVTSSIFIAEIYLINVSDLTVVPSVIFTFVLAILYVMGTISITLFIYIKWLLRQPAKDVLYNTGGRENPWSEEQIEEFMEEESPEFEGQMVFQGDFDVKEDPWNGVDAEKIKEKYKEETDFYDDGENKNE